MRASFVSGMLSAARPLGAVRESRSCIMAQRRILIVDDESYIVSILSLKFRQLGDQVFTASDGREGFTAACAELPDLIISDYQMPGMTGLQMATRLRQNPATAHIPVILLTARAHRLEPGQLNQTGIRQVLDKPFSVREVIARAEELTRIPAGRK